MPKILPFEDLRHKAELGREQREADARLEYMREVRPLQIIAATRELARREITDAEYFELQMKTIRSRG